MLDEIDMISVVIYLFRLKFGLQYILLFYQKKEACKNIEVVYISQVHES